MFNVVLANLETIETALQLNFTSGKGWVFPESLEIAYSLFYYAFEGNFLYKFCLVLRIN